VPRGFRQAGFVVVQQLRFHHVHGRDDVPLIHAHLYPVLAAEALGTTDIAVIAHINHGLLIGINPEAPEVQKMVVHGSSGVVVA
jgi:hypothetical protein